MCMLVTKLGGIARALRAIELRKALRYSISKSRGLAEYLAYGKRSIVIDVRTPGKRRACARNKFENGSLAVWQ